MALLGEVAIDASRALGAVEQDERLIEDDGVAAAARLVREIVGQEFEPGEDDEPPRSRGRRGRQIISAEDPEMRHGRTTAARPFTGYKIHAAVDTEAPLVTSV